MGVISHNPRVLHHNSHELVTTGDPGRILLMILQGQSCGIYLLSLLFMTASVYRYVYTLMTVKKGKRKVQGVPQSQTAALPRPQEEEKTDKSKQAQIEQTYEKH